MYSRGIIKLKTLNKKVLRRQYSTNHSLILNGDVAQLKLDRLGSELDNFKRSYEGPLLKAYLDVQELKARELKKIQNRDSRRKSIKKRWEKHDSQEVDKDLVDTHEIDIKREYEEYLKHKKDNPSNFLDFMLGRHPGAKDFTNNKKILETIPPRFYALDYEAVDSNRDISLGDYFTNEAPEKLKQTGRQWEFEKGLSKSQLLKAITTDLLEHGLTVNEESRVIEGSFSSILQGEFDTGLGDNYFPIGGLEKPLDFDNEIADTENPLLLKYEEVAEKKWSKKKTNSIDFISGNYPLVLQTVDFPGLSAMKDDVQVPTKLIMKKAILRVHVDNLSLPKHVLSRFLELCGSRYNKATRVVKIVSDTKPSQIENVGNVYKLFRDLISESWKSDLNYIPPTVDRLAPHQNIELEIEAETLMQKLEEENDPKNFIRDEHVFFKAYDIIKPSVPSRPAHEVLEELKSI